MEIGRLRAELHRLRDGSRVGERQVIEPLGTALVAGVAHGIAADSVELVEGSEVRARRVVRRGPEHEFSESGGPTRS
jgi:hypothetical protein